MFGQLGDAVVGVRDQKLVDQIAFAVRHFNAFVTRIAGQLRAADKRASLPFDAPALKANGAKGEIGLYTRDCATNKG